MNSIGSECDLAPCILDYIMDIISQNPHRSDDYFQNCTLLHFGISFALYIEVPILVSKIACVDFCPCPLFFLPPLLLERMSLTVRWFTRGVHVLTKYLCDGVHAISFSLLD